jgi:hypothetical protein
MTSGSDIGPKFLQWDTTESAPPEGHIGNPSFPHKVVGSTHVPDGETAPANYFRIERITGPGGTVTSTVGQTDRFLLQGKLAGPPTGAFIGRASAFSDTMVGASAERTVTIRNGVFVPAPPAAVPAAAAVVPVAGQAVAGTSAAAPRLGLRTLALASRISRTRLRLQGLRLVMRLPADTDLVRVRIYRVRANGTRRLESQSFRVPTANLFRMRITDRRLLARLAPGRYQIEVAPNHSRTRLGGPTVRDLPIVR